MQLSEKSIQASVASTATKWISTRQGSLNVEAQAGELADPWGNRYVVAVDMTHDGRVGEENLSFADGEVIRRGAAVWSWGPTNQGRTCKVNKNDKTHIRSWR